MCDMAVEDRIRSVEYTGRDLSSVHNLYIEHQVGTTTSRHHLQQLPLEKYDSVLIFSDDAQYGSIEADARALTTLLLIRDIQTKRITSGPTQGRRRAQSEWLDRYGQAAEKVTIISEILDSATKKLFSQTAEVSDYVMSNELLSMYLAMVAEDREMNEVLQELLSAAGNEIYVRDIGLYLCDDEAVSSEVSFWDVTARGRLRAEIAIGYVCTPDALQGNAAGICINPSGKDKGQSWSHVEALIVLAEN